MFWTIDKLVNIDRLEMLKYVRIFPLVGSSANTLIQLYGNHSLFNTLSMGLSGLRRQIQVYGNHSLFTTLPMVYIQAIRIQIQEYYNRSLLTTLSMGLIQAT